MLNLEGVTPYTFAGELRRYCAEHRPKHGLMVEFGVFNGNSINELAEQFPDETLYGFDSGDGLQEAWNGYGVGAFKADEEFKEKLRPNVVYVEGYFNASLPEFLKQNTEPFAYVHIDCDLYSSTHDIFTLAHDRFVDGTMIVFDEFHNYRGSDEHEYKAFMEFIESSGMTFSYIGYTSHQQVGVKLHAQK